MAIELRNSAAAEQFPSSACDEYIPSANHGAYHLDVGDRRRRRGEQIPRQHGEVRQRARLQHARSPFLKTGPGILDSVSTQCFGHSDLLLRLPTVWMGIIERATS